MADYNGFWLQNNAYCLHLAQPPCPLLHRNTTWISVCALNLAIPRLLTNRKHVLNNKGIVWARCSGSRESPTFGYTPRDGVKPVLLERYRPTKARCGETALDRVSDRNGLMAERSRGKVKDNSSQCVVSGENKSMPSARMRTTRSIAFRLPARPPCAIRNPGGQRPH